MWTPQQRQLHNVLDRALAEKVKRQHLYVMAKARVQQAHTANNKKRYAMMVAVFDKARKKAAANAQLAKHNFNQSLK